jgi:DedD protein
VLSLSKRKDPAPAGGDEGGSLSVARTRARRRLVGAAVLVGIGIIAFPLLFETQPRPIAVDIPIEIPPRDGVAPPALPASNRAAAPARDARPAPGKVAEPAAEIVERAEMPASAPPRAAAPAALPRAAAPVPTASAPVEARGAASAPRTAQAIQAAPDAAEPPSASAPKGTRYVVQAGAYTDPVALRDARQKVEKLGLKTYTQVIDSDAGARTRVRVGPFATREEAERAAGRIKSAGVAANILTL